MPSHPNKISLPNIAERDIQKAILQYLTIRGYVFKRNNSGMMFSEHNGKKRAVKIGEPGWPDLLGMTKEGRFVGIEVKARKGEVTPLQIAIIDRINASGGMAFVARSVDEVIERGF